MVTSVSIFYVENRFYWPIKGSGGLQHHKCLTENSILKIFGSVDVKITPDFCFKVFAKAKKKHKGINLVPSLSLAYQISLPTLLLGTVE